LPALEAEADLDSCSPLYVTLTKCCNSWTHNNNLKMSTVLQESDLMQQRRRALNLRPVSLHGGKFSDSFS